MSEIQLYHAARDRAGGNGLAWSAILLLSMLLPSTSRRRLMLAGARNLRARRFCRLSRTVGLSGDRSCGSGCICVFRYL